MNLKLETIKPGIGLGIIKFGMTRDEIKTLIGEPDEIDAHSYTDNDKELTENWYYDDLELSLNFDEEENWRLVIISVYSDFYQYEKRIYNGLKKTELFKQLKEMDLGEYIIEDCSNIENPDQKLIELDSISMNFWINEGILEEIQWSPNFIDDDTIDWPE